MRVSICATDWSGGRPDNPKTQKAPKGFLCVALFQNFMAGTTRLELATSAVTGQREQVLQQLTRTRGLPNAAQAILNTSFCGLNCGLEISCLTKRNAPAEEAPFERFARNKSTSLMASFFAAHFMFGLST